MTEEKPPTVDEIPGMVFRGQVGDVSTINGPNAAWESYMDKTSHDSPQVGEVRESVTVPT